MRVNCKDGTVSVTEHEMRWLIKNHHIQAMAILLFFKGTMAELNSLLTQVSAPEKPEPVPGTGRWMSSLAGVLI